jgi:hypothetical protein
VVTVREEEGDWKLRECARRPGPVRRDRPEKHRRWEAPLRLELMFRLSGERDREGGERGVKLLSLPYFTRVKKGNSYGTSRRKEGERTGHESFFAVRFTPLVCRQSNHLRLSLGYYILW